MRFSDLPFIDNTKYEFVAVFQNSHLYHKTLLMRNSHQLETVVDNILSYVSTA